MMTSSISGAPVTPGRLVGQRVKRKEDPRLIRGQATYVDDIKLAGMLHLAFKRSDVAHGKILHIDTRAAAAMPGVVMVATGADMKERLAPMPVMTPFPKPDHWPIAWDKVRFVGDPVAVVVARDRYSARDAVDAIEVQLEMLPAVTNPELAMQDGAALVHDEFPNNIAVDRLLGGTDTNRVTGEHDDRKIEEAFAKADVVVSQRMVNQRLAPTCMETRGVVAHYDPGTQALTVWTSTQTPHWVKNHLAAGLGLSEHLIRVIAPEVGGGFGAKKIYGEDYVAAALSMQLGQPVKWIADRTESFMTTTHGRDQVAEVEIAAQRDGTLLGARVRIIADIGAYQMLATALVPTLTMGLLSGLYAIPVLRAELREVYTNKMPTDAYRGAGRPESIYYVERGMDMLARELGMDPAELRRKNFIQPQQFPFRTQAGSVYDSGEYERLLDKALHDAHWEQLKAERDAARAAGRLVGLGLACYVEVCGLGPSSFMPTGGWEYGSVSVERSGKISATTGSSAHGQGHETTFAQLLSDEFGGLPLDDIAILHGDTAVARHGIGTFGSRSQAVGGTALKRAAGKVRAKMARFAATMLEAQEDDIVFQDQKLFVRGVPESAIAFKDVAAYAYVPTTLPPDTEPGLSEEAFWEPTSTNFPYGCYIVQVEIDRDTGEIKLQKLVGVDDCGVIINPLIVEGQVHGGLAQGIGQALFEEVMYDDYGQLLTGSLMDYAIPRATAFPRFELSHTVTPTPTNPIGAKGIGEAGTVGSTPAVVNAVVDALSGFGVKHVDMVLRAEKIWRLINA